MTASSPPVARLAESLEHLHALISGRVFERLADTLHAGELSFSRVNALYALYHRGPQSIADLAKSVRLSHAATSRLVSALVRDGLAERGDTAEDRRRRRVEITDAGRARLHDLRAFTEAAYRELLAGLPPAPLARAADALQELGPTLPQHPIRLAASPGKARRNP